MSIVNALASVAVKDLVAASRWYERLLGRPADSTPMPELAEWRFANGGWLQVYENRGRSGGGSVTLAVDDLDGQMDKLIKLGIDPGNVLGDTRTRVVMIKDPDGNSIAFAQTRDGMTAR